MAILAWTVAAIVGGLLVWRGSDLLETSSEQLSRYYGLPPIVHGAMVVAIGSSFPELSSTVLATLLHGEFELGLSVVVGSAIFNILVIPGLSALLASDGVHADKELVYKDAQFYLISVAVFVLTFSFALIYNPDSGGPGGEAALNGTMTRPLALIPLALYGLYVFIQQQEVGDATVEPPPDDLRPGRQWAVLGLSLVLVVVGVEGLVRAALYFGEVTGIPPFVWGITVIAAVTSVPDALISIRLAERGEGVVSMSNVLGSNIFDLLVAVPVGVLIAGSVSFAFGVAVPLVGFLTLATIVLFTLLRTELHLSRNEGWVLTVSYGVFVAWMVLEQVGVVSLLPTGAT